MDQHVDPMSPEMSRRHLRTILLKIHPDYFSSHKAMQHSNSEALKLLKAYLDRVAQGKRVDAFTISCFIEEERAGRFKAVSVAMPRNGSLAPLFHAFGLISDADLRKAESDADKRQKQRGMWDLLAWFVKLIAEIARRQQEFAKQELELRVLRSVIMGKFELDALNVGRCMGDMMLSELQVLQRQVVHLQALERSLLRLQGAGRSFHGLEIQLTGSTDSVFPRGKRVHMDPEDGTIYLVAGSNTLDRELASLDPCKARCLKMAAESFCDRFKKQVEAAALLGVDDVDTIETITPGHQSLTWVQRLLELNDDRQMVQEAMASCSTQHLSVITIVLESKKRRRPKVHPHVPDWLLVSSSSNPKDLVDFLCSKAGRAAARQAYDSRKADEELQGRVRQALGCRSVSTASRIRAMHRRTWHDAAQRLLKHSQLLRSSVDLSGLRLWLGDKYEIRAERGSVTIPCNFKVEDLPRQLRLLMARQQGLKKGVFKDIISHSLFPVVAASAILSVALRLLVPSPGRPNVGQLQGPRARAGPNRGH